MLKPTEEMETHEEVTVLDNLAQSNVNQFIKDGDFDPSLYVLENGRYVYTDQVSGVKYEWNNDKKEWTVVENKPGAAEEYEFDGETYIHRDSASGMVYRWDKEKLVWNVGMKQSSADEPVKNDMTSTYSMARSDEEEFDDDDDDMDDDGKNKVGKQKEVKRQDMSQGVYGYDGSTHTYTDSKDGTVYLWDRDKNAWFPKIDDDFIARYQMNYGFNTSESDAVGEMKEISEKKDIPPPPPIDEKVDPVKRKQDPTWFDVSDKDNTKVYVSNLPNELTESEFVEFMQKCGLVMKDPDNGKMKIKLYTDTETGNFKGDALCTYIKVESVDLALKILDGFDLKGKKVKVERAKFTMKGNAYDPKLKPKKKRKKDLEKIKKMQQKLFDWRPEKLRGERDKHERVVVVKNLFEPSIFDDDVGLILEYQQDLREECTKCGRVGKVTIYDRHPDGVAQIVFKEAEAADACIQLLHNRWFGKRQITAETWDGKTKYKVAETEEQAKERMKKWEKYIESEDRKKKESAENKDVESGEETRSSADSDETDEEAQAEVPKKQSLKKSKTQSSENGSNTKE